MCPAPASGVGVFSCRKARGACCTPVLSVTFETFLTFSVGHDRNDQTQQDLNGDHVVYRYLSEAADSNGRSRQNHPQEAIPTTIFYAVDKRLKPYTHA